MCISFSFLNHLKFTCRPSGSLPLEVSVFPEKDHIWVYHPSFTSVCEGPVVRPQCLSFSTRLECRVASPQDSAPGAPVVSGQSCTWMSAEWGLLALWTLPCGSPVTCAHCKLGMRSRGLMAAFLAMLCERWRPGGLARVALFTLWPHPLASPNLGLPFYGP